MTFNISANHGVVAEHVPSPRLRVNERCIIYSASAGAGIILEEKEAFGAKIRTRIIPDSISAVFPVPIAVLDVGQSVASSAPQQDIVVEHPEHRIESNRTVI